MSTSEPKSQTTSNTPKGALSNALSRYRPVISATAITACLVLLLVFIYPNSPLTAYLHIKIAYTIPALLLISAIIGYVSTLWAKLDYLQSLLVTVTSNVTLWFCGLFFIRISDTELSLNNTPVSLVLISGGFLTILFFFLHYTFYTSGRFRFVIKALLVFLFLITNFGFIASVVDLGGKPGVLYNPALDFVFGIFSPIVFNVLTAFAITLITLEKITITTWVEQILRTAIYLAINIQIVFAVYFLSISEFGYKHLTYWYLSLFGFILWDFGYRMSKKYFRIENQDTSLSVFYKDFAVTASYYIALLLFILYYDRILALFSL